MLGTFPVDRCASGGRRVGIGGSGGALGHLQDPTRFGASAPLPTVSRDDPSFWIDMFRGPMWAILNWLAIRALEQQQHVDGVAAQIEHLVNRTIAVVAAGYEAYGTVFEFCEDLGTPFTQNPQLMSAARSQH